MRKTSIRSQYGHFFFAVNITMKAVIIKVTYYRDCLVSIKMYKRPSLDGDAGESIMGYKSIIKNNIQCCFTHKIHKRDLSNVFQKKINNQLVLLVKKKKETQLHIPIESISDLFAHCKLSAYRSTTTASVQIQIKFADIC